MVQFLPIEIIGQWLLPALCQTGQNTRHIRNAVRAEEVGPDGIIQGKFHKAAIW